MRPPPRVLPPQPPQGKQPAPIRGKRRAQLLYNVHTCGQLGCVGGPGGTWGDPRGRGGSPPSRPGKRRSATGRRAQPGTGRPRGLRVPGPAGGRREHSPQWPPPKGLNGRRMQIVGRGSSQGVKCRLGSSEQRSLYSEIVTAVTGTLGSEEPTLGKLEGFASRESQLNAD